MSSIQDEITYLKGVGPQRAKNLEKLGIFRIEDIFYFMPRRYLDRSQLKKIFHLVDGEESTVEGEVVDIEAKETMKGKHIYTITLYDQTDYLSLNFFNQSFIKNVFEKGDQVVVSGKVTIFKLQKQMVHPEYEIISDNTEELLHTGRIVPLYPLTHGLYQKNLRKIIKNALDMCLEQVPETLPEFLLGKYKFPPIQKAFQNLHYPQSIEDKDSARERMAFEELFYLEMMLLLRKRQFQMVTSQNGIAFVEGGQLCRALVDSLNFDLTKAQKRVIREIFADMNKPITMNRLLQGDVGSGKTIVAILAMLYAVENGYQAAIMAPTEILADQHYRKISGYLASMKVDVTFLVGGMRKAEREEAYAKIADGRAQIIVGTHALIQEALDFQNLGFIVVDEQHRFGVMQRAALREKGRSPDVLVMSATPIPRTLALTIYGDLDISSIDEMPPGRQNILTRWTTASHHKEVYEVMQREIGKGRQVYVIYPLIEESEKMDLKAATTMAAKLQKDVFPDLKVGLLHGRMRNQEKDEIMKLFLEGQYHILVSTTVIEVGMDVPNASVMVVENAERFGLTQLHQLRGRVGRGEYQSYCILVASTQLSQEARERLEIIQSTTNGFTIAEADLKFRGPGEFFGTRQHGLPELRIANLVDDTHLLFKARDEANAVIQDDPNLKKREHAVIRSTIFRKYLEKFQLTEIG